MTDNILIVEPQFENRFDVTAEKVFAGLASILNFNFSIATSKDRALERILSTIPQEKTSHVILSDEMPKDYGNYYYPEIYSAKEVYRASIKSNCKVVLFPFENLSIARPNSRAFILENLKKGFGNGCIEPLILDINSIFYELGNPNLESIKPYLYSRNNNKGSPISWVFAYYLVKEGSVPTEVVKLYNRKEVYELVNSVNDFERNRKQSNS